MANFWFYQACVEAKFCVVSVESDVVYFESQIMAVPTLIRTVISILVVMAVFFTEQDTPCTETRQSRIVHQ
jgi:hypothetical protein